MLTFLELYQTLLGFVFFKLYTDVGLVYPPPIDLKKDEGAAGVNAFNLRDTDHFLDSTSQPKVVEVDGRRISGKDVRQIIKNIVTSPEEDSMNLDRLVSSTADAEDEFVEHGSKPESQSANPLPTLKSLISLPQSFNNSLFSPYTFFLSRETSRPMFEFLVRSFGGRIGWPSSSGSGSSFNETDESITHVIIDRPVVELNDTPEQRELRLRRKFVQPQWIVDCINAGKILLEEPYLQGKTLPPHLSPFGEYEGAYDPTQKLADEDDEASVSEGDETNNAAQSALEAVPEDAAALRTAELSAEAAGVDHDTFEKELGKARKKQRHSKLAEVDSEQDMNKMMLSNKQRKLFEKVKHAQKKRASEVRLSMTRGVDR